MQQGIYCFSLVISKNKYANRKSSLSIITTVFVDTRLSKTKHPRKRFQNFCQSCMLSTDRIEIHHSHTSGCDWWISLRSVHNTHDWRKFGKRFNGCFDLESRISRKTVVKTLICNNEFFDCCHLMIATIVGCKVVLRKWCPFINALNVKLMV